ncbi:hypothetical protein ES703_87884 [subsurface metagenome]
MAARYLSISTRNLSSQSPVDSSSKSGISNGSTYTAPWDSMSTKAWSKSALTWGSVVSASV